MIGPKQARPGESYRQLVTILKVRRGVPTVIRVDEREYVLRHADQYRGGVKHDRAQPDR
jgi:hypothetical protein